MSAVVFTALTVVLILFSFVLHGVVRATAMRNLGVGVTEVGVGLSVGPRLVLPAGKMGSLSFSPLPILAYVKPDERDEEYLRQLPYRDGAWVYGSGLISGYIFGLLLVGASLLIREDRMVVAAGACVVLAAVVWLLRRFIVQYLVPVLGLLTVFTTSYALALDFGKPMGLAGTGALLYRTNLADALWFAGIVSIVVAVTNMWPLATFDGSYIMDMLLRRWWGPRVARVWKVVGTVILCLLVGYLVVSDVFYLV